MTRDEIIDKLSGDELVIFLDGFDKAIIGLAERINLGPVVAYDTDKIIAILMLEMTVEPDEIDGDMTREDIKYLKAVEYFDFNIKGAWMGENTPIFIETN